MSHEEQTDLRIRRTHKFLQEAMIELIAKKGFESITVGDITECAMINRTTFYRHYQDKYDLVAKIFEETMDQLMENMKHLSKEAAMGTEMPPAIWVQIFEHIAEHARLYRAMLGKNGSPWFVARMHEHIIKLMRKLEQQWEHQGELAHPIDPSMPQELPVTQFSHVLIGTIVWWLESEKRYTPRQVATWFHRFTFHGYLSMRGYEASWQRKE